MQFDFDAYSGENVSVTSLAHTLERYAGGHIHIGYPSPNVDKNEKIVKWMDIYTGLPSVFLDEDDKRKSIMVLLEDIVRNLLV